jgi:hypothetical protein
MGLTEDDLDRFVGLQVGEARRLASERDLSLFEAVVDGERRIRMMAIACEFLSVVVENGTVVRVLGLG